jgi:hypothetical protein
VVPKKKECGQYRVDEHLFMQQKTLALISFDIYLLEHIDLGPQNIICNEN